MGGNQSKEHWQPDESRKDCAKCKSAFNSTNRRHHCRNCGGIFCNNCSSKQTTVARRGITTPVRVCDACFSTLNSSQNDAGSKSTQSPQTQKDNTVNNGTSPARNDNSNNIIIQPQTIAATSSVVDVIPQVALTTAYGAIKDEAGKNYLDVAGAAVREVTLIDESQCSEQQYEFDAAGVVDLSLPKPSTSDANSVVALLLADDANTSPICGGLTEDNKMAIAEALAQINNLPFPNLVAPFTQRGN